MCSLRRTHIYGTLEFSSTTSTPLVFAVRSYEVLFPSVGILDCTMWTWAGKAHSPGVPPSLYPPQVNVGPPIPQAVSTAALLQPPHHILAAPFTCLDECFFFKSLVVRLPYSLVFWQFWLYFVLRLVVILPMVLQGGKACLPMPPS